MLEEKQGLSEEFKEALATEAEKQLGDLESARHGKEGEARFNAFLSDVRAEICAVVEEARSKAPQAKSEGEKALEAEAKAKKDASAK